jgi:hypothetical protein
MAVANALERRWIALSPVGEEVARLALRYVEMGPVGQPS